MKSFLEFIKEQDYTQDSLQNVSQNIETPFEIEFGGKKYFRTGQTQVEPGTNNKIHSYQSEVDMTADTVSEPDTIWANSFGTVVGQRGTQSPTIAQASIQAK